jgi:hypothetical protein
MSLGKGLTLPRFVLQQTISAPGSLGVGNHRTLPYFGAGYKGHMGESTGINAWRFQADMGFIALNASNAAKLGRVLSGNQGFDELIRELRLRPVVKFSINYKF